MTPIVEPECSQRDAIRLFIVTRQRLFGDALAALFRAHAEFSVLCTTTSIQVALSASRHRRPNLVLLDAEMIGEQASQNIGSLAAQMGGLPILLLDDYVHYGRLAAILPVPGIGYFTRGSRFSDLATGIRNMVAGERAFDSAVQKRVVQTPHGCRFRPDKESSLISRLTRRETEVLKLVALGHSVKHCAELLDVAQSTVDNHKSRLMKKLGLHKSLDLVRLALREGLIET
jgi:DNA-binding NarL/FixJ family response regulator